MRLGEGLWHHGTMADFDELKLDVPLRSRPVGNWYGYLGLHFTRDRELAEAHATLRANDRAQFPLAPEGFRHSRVLSARIEIERALLVDDESALDELAWQLLSPAQRGKYDTTRHASKYVVLRQRPRHSGQILRRQLLREGYDAVLYQNLGLDDELRGLRELERPCLIALDPSRIEVVAVNIPRAYGDQTPLPPLGPRGRLSPLAAWRQLTFS